MLQVIELLAVVSAAVYGVLRANRMGFDAVGMLTLAFAVAFAGGTLRDLFLFREPLFWIANPKYVWIVFGLAVAGACVPRVIHRVEPYLAVPDAFGLGLFSVVGTGYALEAGTDWLTAVFMGVVTGTFGGVIADVVCNEVPNLFRKSPLYATCSFVGGWVYLLLDAAGAGPAAGAAGFAVIVVLRLVALRRDWVLPQARGAEAGENDK